MVLFVMLTVNLVTHVPWMFGFGKQVQGTENLLRRRTNHKWFLFTMGQMRTFLWVYIIVFLATDNFAVPQLFLAILLNPVNLFLAWNMKPLPMFFCLNLNTVVKTIGVCALLITYQQLAMSDVTKAIMPSSKIMIGWVILIAG